MNRTLLDKLRSGGSLSVKEQVLLIISLSMPAIISQLTTVLMEYIDAAMVGRLGAEGAASIGLVSSSTWLTAGICTAAGVGFSVQIAHLTGAKENRAARSVMKHGLLTAVGFSIVLGAAGALFSFRLPGFLGGAEEIRRDASAYFRIFALFLPVLQIRFTAGGMLQSSGEMKIPGILNILSCFLDVIFNLLLIFPSGTIQLPGKLPALPGLGLGVAGAALGTALSETVCAALMLYFLLLRSDLLHLRKEEPGPAGTYRRELKKALSISLPVGIEHAVTGGAQVTSTRIVSPLGTVAIAANSFAVNAEGLCYMPGYGISAAAATAVGQSIGAERSDLTKRLSWISMFLGMGIMGAAGAVLYLFSPQVMGLLTPVKEVSALGTKVLRVELIAEPLFAASIVGAGIFRGAGQTRGSTIINLLGMWVVRLPLAFLLSRTGNLGLTGVWIAMCLDLCIRGLLFLIRLGRKRW